VSDLPAPSASRLAKARWLDARLLIGLLLVLLSVVVGAKVVADADQRVKVWSVTHDLGADTPLSSDDLAPASVSLDDSTGRYLSASEDLDGLVLTRPVGRGELLPVSAVGRSDASTERRITIEVDRTGVAGITKGRVVDVYAVRDDNATGPSTPPELVLSGVTVAEDVKSSGGTFGGGGSTVGVTLLVDQTKVPGLIDAVAHGSIYLVQVPGGGTTGS
jgi:hypothetical protein